MREEPQIYDSFGYFLNRKQIVVVFLFGENNGVMHGIENLHNFLAAHEGEPSIMFFNQFR